MKFECAGCGFCCKNFGDENHKYLPLFECEVERYKKIAESRNIKLNFKPVHYLLEEKSGIVFVYLYGMTNEPCPFLKNNKCSVYEDRALICGQFPLLWTAKFHGNEFGASCFSECPKFDCKKEFDEKFPIREVSKDEIDKYLKETYGGCFDFAIKSNSHGRKILDIIRKYDLNGDWKLKNISESDLGKYKQMSFTEFLKYCGFREDAGSVNQCI